MSQAATPTLRSLAATVTSAIDVIYAELASTGTPEPSLSAEGPPRAPNGSQALSKARYDLLTAIQQLQVLAFWPHGAVQHQTFFGLLDCVTIGWLVEFNVCDAVPLDDTTTFADVAAKCALDLDQLTSVLRYAMTCFWFSEPEPGMICHSALSALMLKDPQTRSRVKYVTSINIQAFGRLWEATRKQQGLRRQGKDPKAGPTCFNLAFDTDKHVMEWATKDHDNASTFSDTMAELQLAPPHSAQHIVNGFDWASLGEGHVVDVSGLDGSVCVAIARAVPGPRFTVQDQPHAVAEGKIRLPSDLSNRITFQAHNFFDENPVDGPDVFFMRIILHDWPEHKAIQILRALIPRMIPNKTRLVVADMVHPDVDDKYGSLPHLPQRLTRSTDVTMALLMNAKERTRSQWEALFHAADPSLGVVDIKRPEGSAMSLIEVVKVE